MKISSEKLNNLTDLRLRVGNQALYLDVDEFISQIEFGSTHPDNKLELNLPRFEFFKLMLETVCGIVEDVDDTLGVLSLNKLSVPYKLSLNTLIKYKIIKKL